MVQNIEFAQIEMKVLEGLQAGNECLHKMHQVMSIEEVERILDETQDAVQYQRQIDELLAGSFTQEDEDAILAELDAITQEQLELPEVPTEPLLEETPGKPPPRPGPGRQSWWRPPDAWDSPGPGPQSSGRAAASDGSQEACSGPGCLPRPGHRASRRHDCRTPRDSESGRTRAAVLLVLDETETLNPGPSPASAAQATPGAVHTAAPPVQLLWAAAAQRPCFPYARCPLPGLAPAPARAPGLRVGEERKPRDASVCGPGTCRERTSRGEGTLRPRWGPPCALRPRRQPAVQPLSPGPGSVAGRPRWSSTGQRPPGTGWGPSSPGQPRGPY